MGLKHILLLLLLTAGISTASYNQTARALGPFGSDSLPDFAHHNGQIHCFSFHPDYEHNGIVFAGSAYGGLYQSKDFGKNWAAVKSVEQLPVNSVNDIAFDPLSPQTVYISTGATSHNVDFIPSAGLYKSNDGGQQFMPVESFNQFYGFNAAADKRMTKIAIHPSKPNTMLLATSDGLYRSEDAGLHWEITLVETEYKAFAQTRGIFSVEFSKTNPEIVYASGNHFYRSTDGGKNFDRFDPPDFEKECAELDMLNILSDVNSCFDLNQRNDSDIIYLSAAIQTKKIGYRIYRYNGRQWESLTINASIPDMHRLRLVSHPDNPDWVWCGERYIYYSTNGGERFQSMSAATKIHDDFHALECSPLNELFIGTDGGIYIDRDLSSPANARPSNNGLDCHLIWQISSAQSKTERVGNGYQDNGFALYDKGEWISGSRKGDSYPPVWIDPCDSNAIICRYNQNSFLYTHPNQLPEQYRSLKICPASNELNFILADPNDCQSIYTQKNASADILHIRNYADVNPTADQQQTIFRIPENSLTDYVPADVKISENGEIMYWTNRSFNEYSPPALYKINLTKSITADCGQAANCPITDCAEKISYLPSAPRNKGKRKKWRQAAIHHYPIESMAVAGPRADTLWLCIHSKNLSITQQSYRILRSSDGGKTFSPDEAGLPTEFPMDKIIYIKSRKCLFATTQNGLLYYKKSYSEIWQAIHPELPHSRIMSLSANEVAGILYIGYWGKGLYSIKLPE